MDKILGIFPLVHKLPQIGKSILEVEDIYIPNDIREALNVSHVSKLKRIGWWEK